MTPRHFAWQAWHLGHWAGSGAAWTGLVASDAGALCVAGVALGDIHLGFAWQWQAWCLGHWAGFGGTLGINRQCRHGTLRGRCGTWRHPLSFCVAGVVLRALGWLWWRAWTGLVAGDAAALCVAGVALGDMCLRFTWQAWHLVLVTYTVPFAWHLATSTFVSRGRRGT